MAEDFGEFITARRRELDLTLGDVATRLDVSPVTVSNWSNGQATPGADQLEALADVLDVPVVDLSSMAGIPIETETETETETEDAGDAEIEVAPTPEEEVEEISVQEPGSPSPDAADADIDDELAEMIDEASGEAEVEEDKVAAVEAPAAPVVEAATAPAPAPTPPTAAPTVTAERPRMVLPLTYIEDPKQLLRYRIRWGLTVVVLGIMFFILIWAAGGLISALSEIKDSVTPGGGS